MKKISIIGGGWLGQPLAHYLSTLGHTVSVSRTTTMGATELCEQHLNGFQFDLSAPLSESEHKLEATKPDIVIGCFPPGFRKGRGDEYAHYWHTLVSLCQSLDVSRLVMVSSTTVYPNSADDMTEDSASLELATRHNHFSDNAVIMLQAEQSLIDSGLSYAIVRCSGLIGPERHPSRFASKLKQVSSLAPANMLHLTDAVGAVSFMALNEISGVVNATTPNTVSKAEFYQSALDNVGSDDPLPPVVEIKDKRIVSNKLQDLGYRFHFDHTLEAI
ncbi:NAD-dependent epimerase/dehydratase family protein [Vibrio sp. RE86]|uniref:NAD-dependent epimerase/dehydratase family protein n=1 Tax=Vibrio sp. RE86 TaxID=2607605 RepID=UPI0014935208|nr:NAD-dependent epimerase/dehydratase family protein [Vibrio sp. RE86]